MNVTPLSQDRPLLSNREVLLCLNSRIFSAHPKRTLLKQRLFVCLDSQPSGYLHAVVVCAFPIQVAAVIVHTTVIQGAEAHEAVLEGIITFLVHVVMPNHILFTSESLERDRQTVRRM